MALNTFAAIKTAVADWAFTGASVSATLVGTDFFPQVQSMMYYGDGNDIPALRIRAMIDSATVTPDSGGTITISSAFGSGWLEFVELTPTTSGALSLDYMEPWEFRKEQDKIINTVGPQAIYTVVGDKVYLAPAAVTTIAAKWYEKFTALSADGDTDWIITNAPHVYLNGCLMLACAYADDQREGQFRQKFAASIRGLNRNDRLQRASGSIPVARPRSVA
jgi:hypothetical protein